MFGNEVHEVHIVVAPKLNVNVCNTNLMKRQTQLGISFDGLPAVDTSTIQKYDNIARFSDVTTWNALRGYAAHNPH